MKKQMEKYLKGINKKWTFGVYEQETGLKCNSEHEKNGLINIKENNENFIIHSNDLGVVDCTMHKLNDRKDLVLELVSKMDFSYDNHNLVIELDYNSYYNKDVIYISENITELVPKGYKVFAFDKKCRSYNLEDIVGNLYHTIIIIPKVNSEKENHLVSKILEIAEKYNNDIRTSLISQNNSKILFSNNLIEGLRKIQISNWFGDSATSIFRGTKDIIIPAVYYLLVEIKGEDYNKLFDQTLIQSLLYDDQRPNRINPNSIDVTFPYPTQKGCFYFTLSYCDDEANFIKMEVKYVSDKELKEEMKELNGENKKDEECIKAYNKIIEELLEEYEKVTKENPTNFAYRESLVNMIYKLEKIK